jgi:hypothetical protein
LWRERLQSPAGFEYGQPQGVLRRASYANVLGQLNRNPAAAAAAIKVKLARKVYADEKMEVDVDEHRQIAILVH